MKNTLLMALLMALTTGAAMAQTPQPPAKEYRGYGYGYVGPAAFTSDSDTLLNYGVGGEGLIAGGLGVGAELGGFARGGRVDQGFGALSTNASYHFVKSGRSGKFDPFVTGGYSLFFAGGVANGANFGGGVNYWFKERIGLRVEVRDHILSSDSYNLLGVRIGITFR